MAPRRRRRACRTRQAATSPQGRTPLEAAWGYAGRGGAMAIGDVAGIVCFVSAMRVDEDQETVGLEVTDDEERGYDY